MIYVCFLFQTSAGAVSGDGGGGGDSGQGRAHGGAGSPPDGRVQRILRRIEFKQQPLILNCHHRECWMIPFCK